MPYLQYETKRCFSKIWKIWNSVYVSSILYQISVKMTSICGKKQLLRQSINQLQKIFFCAYRGIVSEGPFMNDVTQILITSSFASCTHNLASQKLCLIVREHLKLMFNFLVFYCIHRVFYCIHWNFYDVGNFRVSTYYQWWVDSNSLKFNMKKKIIIINFVTLEKKIWGI